MTTDLVGDTNLAQYYTMEAFAHLLVDRIEVREGDPRSVLDLGVGRGALLKAAYRRWPNANYWAADVDPAAFSELRAAHQNVAFVRSDILSEELSISVWGNNSACGDFDIAVCNPPFVGRLSPGHRCSSSLRAIGLGDDELDAVASGPAVFLGVLLQHLRPHGQLGVILPDGIVSGVAFRPLRRALVQCHGVRTVIELPSGVFAQTEARTHILVLEKNGRTPECVSLHRADRTGRLALQDGEVVAVDRDRLIARMDYGWHHWCQHAPPAGADTLGALGIGVARGTLSARDLRQRGGKFLHTSDIPTDPDVIDVGLSDSDLGTSGKAGHYVQAGDIVVARVGTRCVGRRARVIGGSVAISDCVYRIRPPGGNTELGDRIWETLSSDWGRQWLVAKARGVCALAISKRDLLDFPVW